MGAKIYSGDKITKAGKKSRSLENQIIIQRDKLKKLVERFKLQQRGEIEKIKEWSLMLSSQRNSMLFLKKRF